MKVPNLQFRYNNKLLYFIERNNKRRLYIPASIQKDVFAEVHNQHHHFSFQRTYEAISSTIFVRNLTNTLKRYIEHYPQYHLNQTKRYKPYDNLDLIISEYVPYHTIAIDFIITLPII